MVEDRFVPSRSGVLREDDMGGDGVVAGGQRPGMDIVDPKDAGSALNRPFQLNQVQPLRGAF